MSARIDDVNPPVRKLPWLQERLLKRLPEFGEMPLDARRCAWREACGQRGDGWRVVVIHVAVAVAYITPYFLFLRHFANDPGWRGDALAFGGFLVVMVPLLLTIHLVEVRFVRGRLRRLLPDLCSSCGYDLTGNTSGVCPECGRNVAPKGQQ